ncbi:hypothetical protein JP0063_10970, partial [Helicobacter pylori]
RILIGKRNKHQRDLLGKAC